MIHEQRQAAEKTALHALRYLLRVLKHGLFNIGYLFVRQQYFQLLFCAVVTLAWNIQTGVIASADSFRNIAALGQVGVTMCVVIVVFSFIAAPFNLDREREEKVTEQEQTITERDAAIKTLRVQIGRASTGSQPVATVTASPQKPPKPPPSKPVVKVAEVGVEGFKFISNQIVFRFNGTESEFSKPDGAVFIVTFKSEVTGTQSRAFSAKTILTFYDSNNQKERLVRKGIWLDHSEEYLDFRSGDFLELVIAYATTPPREIMVYAYEHSLEKWDFGDDILFPTHIPLADKKYKVEVELIVKNYNTDVSKESEWFEFSLDPLEIRRVTDDESGRPDQ